MSGSVARLKIVGLRASPCRTLAVASTLIGFFVTIQRTELSRYTSLSKFLRGSGIGSESNNYRRKICGIYPNALHRSSQAITLLLRLSCESSITESKSSVCSCMFLLFAETQRVAEERRGCWERILDTSEQANHIVVSVSPPVTRETGIRFPAGEDAIICQLLQSYWNLFH
jgi:hypothetical protein